MNKITLGLAATLVPLAGVVGNAAYAVEDCAVLMNADKMAEALECRRKSTGSTDNQKSKGHVFDKPRQRVLCSDEGEVHLYDDYFFAFVNKPNASVHSMKVAILHCSDLLDSWARRSCGIVSRFDRLGLRYLWLNVAELYSVDSQHGETRFMYTLRC